MTDSTQKFEIDAEQAKQALQQLIGAAKQFDEAIKQAGESGDEAAKKGESSFKRFSASVMDGAKHLAGFTAGVAAAAVALQQMAKAGEGAKNVAKAFETLGGTAADLERLRRATNNMVPDTELQKIYNMADMFGVSSGELDKLIKRASGATKALGGDFAQNLDGIMEAYTKKSFERADNFGIKMRKVSEINKEAAAKLGIKVSELSDSQKDAAFSAEFFGKSQKLVTVGATESAKAATQAEAAWENFKSALEVAASDVLETTARKLQEMDARARSLARTLVGPVATGESGVSAKETAENIEKLNRRTAEAKRLMEEVDGFMGSAKGHENLERGILQARVEVERASKALAFWRDQGIEHPGAEEQYNRLKLRLEVLTQQQREYNAEVIAGGHAYATLIINGAKAIDEQIKRVEQAERNQAAARKRRHAERKRQLEQQMQMLDSLAIKTKIGLEGALRDGFGRKQINPLKELFGEGFGSTGLMGNAKANAEAFFNDVSALAERALPSIERYKDASLEIIKAEEAKRAAILSASKDAVGAVMDSVGGQIFGVQELAAIKGAFQLGEGLAAAVTPGMQAAAPGHFASAAQYFLAAATSGGGGSSASAPTSSGTTRSEGPRREMERLDRQGRGGDINVTIENKGWEIRDQDAIRLGDLFERGRELGVRGMGWR